MAIRCFYHSGDWDGVLSAAIVMRNTPNVKLHPINYGHNYDEKVFDVVGSDDTVYMVDFGMKPIKKMVKLNKQCKELIWIDHHSDMIKMSGEIGFNPNGLRVNGIAACVLTWKWFYGERELPEAVYWVGRFDTWQVDHPDVKPFYSGMDTMELDPKLPQVDQLLDDNRIVTNYIMKTGHVIWDFQKKNFIALYKSSAFELDLGDFTAMVCNGYVDIDVMIEEGLYDPLKYHFILMFEKRNKFWKFSMRTRRDDINVSNLCRRFGGGGHPQASGFETADNKFISRMIDGKVLIKREENDNE